MSSKYIKERLLRDEVRRVVVESVLDDDLAVEVKSNIVVGEEVRDKQVLIRVSEAQRLQWQAAAESDGASVSEWLRQMADARWREVFTCTHPLEQRKAYPWSEFCLKCGTRLR